MLQSNKPASKLIVAVTVLLSLVGVVFGALTLFDDSSVNSVWMKLTATGAIIALLFADYYMIDGFKKNAAVYFKIYGALFALTQLFGIVNFAAIHTRRLPLFAAILVFVLAVVLFAGKDLGHKLSYLLTAGTVLFSVFNVVEILMRPSNLAQIPLFLCNLDILILALLYAVMIIAKYADKQTRGRD